MVERGANEYEEPLVGHSLAVVVTIQKEIVMGVALLLKQFIAGVDTSARMLLCKDSSSLFRNYGDHLVLLLTQGVITPAVHYFPRRALRRRGRAIMHGPFIQSLVPNSSLPHLLNL